MSLRNRLAVLLVGLVVGLSLLGAGRLLAQTGFGVIPWTVDGGGDTLSGAPYTLSATIAQPDVGVLAGGSFRLYAGFWGAAEVSDERQERLFLPAITTE